tara:strand:- start:72434 stop:72937 length:504 start_codon:yes stop_codon:yes gene_type:complete
MKQGSKIVFIALLLGVFITSCTKKGCDEPIPQLNFLSFTLVSVDSSDYKLTYSFSDCDGDIGMAPDAKITDENGEVQTNNMLMTPYYMQNGVWVERTYLPGEPGLDNKIPVISNSNVNPAIDGEFDRKINLVGTGLAGYDTLMFKCKILDNAGHYSEEVETPGFIIN